MDNDFNVESDLAISDVIEVLQSADPSFIETPSQAKSSKAMEGEPYVEIVEQPAPKALRFRYECEGRSAGSIPGINTTNENKTFPTIKVFNHSGPCMVVVSCVTKEGPPHLAHPHNLVGKDCEKGVCTMHVDPENMTCQFPNLGIQCVKKKEVEKSLETRQRIRVDPFRQGFRHGSQPSNIDLNAVRLCFQVFTQGDPGKYTHPLTPVVSNTIYDKKANTDLQIIRLSDVSCSVAGGKEIILLCEKVAKDDIEVRLIEEKDGQVVWEAKGEFQPSDVHRQYAIPFRTPAYHNLQVQNEVKLKILLVRPSDNATSEPRDFTFLPLDSATNLVKRKQSKYNETPTAAKRQAVSASASSSERSAVQVGGLPSIQQQYAHPHLQGVKVEPQDVPQQIVFQSPQAPGLAALMASPAYGGHLNMFQAPAQPQQQQQQGGGAGQGEGFNHFGAASAVTFGQPQAHFVYDQQQQQSAMQLVNAAAAAAHNEPHPFPQDDISDNLSGQLRMCGINTNDPGESFSVENMSTDSFCKKYLGDQDQ